MYAIILNCIAFGLSTKSFGVFNTVTNRGNDLENHKLRHQSKK